MGKSFLQFLIVLALEPPLVLGDFLLKSFFDDYTFFYSENENPIYIKVREGLLRAFAEVVLVAAFKIHTACCPFSSVHIASSAWFRLGDVLRIKNRYHIHCGSVFLYTRECV